MQEAGPPSAAPRAGAPALAGSVFILLSAAGFGAMAIFGKLAFDAGVTTLTVLLARFVIASVVFWSLLALGAPGRPARRPAAAAILVGLALGAIGYATQAGLYFAALGRLDASLLGILLYTYPAWVTLASFALGRERVTRRRIAALLLSSAGLVIVLLGASSGAGFDTLGAILGLGAALAYTTYILVADRTGPDLPPLMLSALVAVGALGTFLVIGLAAGELRTDFASDGWLWLGLIGIVSTTLPILLFFAGLERVGPSTASILSTVEPVITAGLAFLAFSERLSVVQIGGAALVLAAAVLLAAPARAHEPVPTV